MTELDVLSRWYEAVALEPRLHDLEEAIRLTVIDRDDPSYWREYSTWEKRLCELVGWNAEKPELRSSRSYHGCHEYLLAVFEGRA